MAECENCIQFKSLEKDILRLNTESVDYEKRISTLEKTSAVSDERFTQVFKKLDDIILILKEKEGRLPTLMWTVGGMILGGVFVGVIMWVFQNAVT